MVDSLGLMRFGFFNCLTIIIEYHQFNLFDIHYTTPNKHLNLHYKLIVGKVYVLGDEGIDSIPPTVGLKSPPRKRAKGKRHNPNKENLEDPY